MKIITIVIEDGGTEPPTVNLGDCDARVALWAFNQAYLAVEETLPAFVVDSIPPVQEW
jgi:hypothetical protein